MGGPHESPKIRRPNPGRLNFMMFGHCCQLLQLVKGWGDPTLVKRRVGGASTLVKRVGRFNS